MSAPQYLYRVSEDGTLQTFKVLLGHGTYVNVQCQESGEFLHMQNRFNLFRETPEAAWSCRATAMQRALVKYRKIAKEGLRRLAMLNRIRTEYSRKQEDIQAAESRVWTDLTTIIRMQGEVNTALTHSGVNTTPENNATTITIPAS